MKKQLQNLKNVHFGLIMYTFLTIMAGTINLFAQSGPDINNVNKTIDAAQQHSRDVYTDELNSYIYMAVGFLVVVAFAWFTNSQVQENRKKSYTVSRRGNLKDPYYRRKFEKELTSKQKETAHANVN